MNGNHPNMYHAKRRTEPWQVVVVLAVMVIIAALAITLVVVLNGNLKAKVDENDDEGFVNIQLPDNQRVTDAIYVNNNRVSEEIAYRDAKTGTTYLPVAAFFKKIGGDCVVSGKNIRITTPEGVFNLEVDSVNVTAENGSKYTLSKAPFINDNGVIVIYARDVAVFLSNAIIDYDKEFVFD